MATTTHNFGAGSRHHRVQYYAAGAFALALLLLPMGTTHAALISLDFNAQGAVTPFPVSPTMTGDEVAGVGTIFTGQVGPWNTLLVGTDTDDGGCCLTNNLLTAPLTTSPLFQGDGTPTGIVFELGTGASVGTPVSYAVFQSAGTGSTALRQDMVVLNSGAPGPLNWRITGLVPGNPYDLVLFGQRFNNAAVNPATFTVFGNPPALFDTQNDGNFLNIVADGSGTITGSMSFPAGNGSWSGLQIQGLFIVPVPEPSTLALLSLGAVGLAVQARRRRAA